MSLQIVREDGVNHALIDDSGTVGWLRPDAIGFRGFAHERETLRAAALAHAILVETLTSATRALHPTSTQRFGPMAWTLDDECYVGTERVGRFLRPFPVPGIGREAFGFELLLRDISSAVREDLARQIHKALAALRTAEAAKDSRRRRSAR